MKTRIIVSICTAMVMAACGGSGINIQVAETCCNAATCSKPDDVKKIISAQVFIKPEKVDAFLALTEDLIEKSRAEAGCISYSLYQDPHDRTKFLFFEEWKNQAAVDYHFSTEHFINFGKALEEMASAPPIITIFDTTKEVRL